MTERARTTTPTTTAGSRVRDTESRPFAVGDRVRLKATAEITGWTGAATAPGSRWADVSPSLSGVRRQFSTHHENELVRVEEEPGRDPSDFGGPAWGDAALPEDNEIRAAHPTRSGRDDLYAEAARLVGARRSKYGLIALVNWLLHRVEAGR